LEDADKLVPAHSVPLVGQEAFRALHNGTPEEVITGLFKEDRLFWSHVCVRHADDKRRGHVPD